ncbi:hypothetical protein N7470_007251 [Penicillium chermesinum]|nr:hypothetical protein N7470_007251 [Penicillium chermesinum]
MQQSRKRRVRTCYPCYTRKQKCNREYPCNHCTRRRRPEECVYSAPPAEKAFQDTFRSEGAIDEAPGPFLEHARPSSKTSGLHDGQCYWSSHCSQHSTIAKSFGYFEDSNSNTMALLRGVGFLPLGSEMDLNDPSPSMWEPIQQELSRMPPRKIIDFLVQYFVYELNWMKQVVHAPSFLTQYQQWWAKGKPVGVADVEYAVLILRICSYATQFLPSSTHTTDQICGRSLSEIRNTCSDVAYSLAKLCEGLDWKGSMFRVQHIISAALTVSCEGRTDQFWEAIASASRAAQKAGIHTNIGSKKSRVPQNDSAQELDKEVRRRVLCSLYVLDSHLSRQLDRVPLLPDHLVDNSLPRLRLIPDVGIMSADIDTNAPDMFTERLMQVQLGQFWRRVGPRRSCDYDPTQSEQRYEKICAEYLPSLHPAFAIDCPDTKWDNALPKLPMQRQLLHIAIFDSVCWNFRPLLSLKPDQIAELAPYKQVLLQSQKRRLGMAAVKVLEAVTALHLMFGGSLYSAMQVAEQAIGRLQLLAELSDMAATGLGVAAQLCAIAAKTKKSPDSVAPESSANTPFWQPSCSADLETDNGMDSHSCLGQADPVLLSDIFSWTAQGDSYSKLPSSSYEFPMSGRVRCSSIFLPAVSAREFHSTKKHIRLPDG